MSIEEVVFGVASIFFDVTDICARPNMYLVLVLVLVLVHITMYVYVSDHRISPRSKNYPLLKTDLYKKVILNSMYLQAERKLAFKFYVAFS